MITAEFLVKGVVQGVGFRWFTRREARNLGLKGFVRNLPDGSVLAVAQGEESAVARLEEALHRGPQGSTVESVTRNTLSYNENYESFEVTV